MLPQGAKAPDFRLTDLDGTAVALDSVLSHGKALLVFFKISCPTCQLALPFLERLHRSGHLPIFGISQDDADDTRDFCRAFRLTFPMLLDPADQNFPASNAYQITNVPSLFLVGTDGKIEWTLQGFSRKGLEDLGQSVGTPILRPEDRIPESKPG